MLTLTETYFLSAIRSFLYPEYECQTHQGVDWQALKAIAQRHCMAGLLYAGAKITKDNCPEFNYFYQSYYKGAFQYATLKREYKSLAEILTEHNISFIPFKGIVLADYYTRPNCRTMSDIDLLVHTADKEKVHELLTNAGFVNDVHADHEWGYRKNNVYFEIHDHLLHNEMVNPKQYQLYCDKCWEFVAIGDELEKKISDDFHYIYLILHLRKHFMNEGVGFRQFVDLCVMTKRDLNWEWIRTQLRDLDLVQFASKVMSLCKRWFGTESPLSTEIDDEFYYSATKKILQDGVFGFDNIDNMNREAANVFMTQDAPIWVSRVLYIMKLFFQPYRIMKTKREYRYIKDLPFLLPFAWVHRGIRVLLHKRNLFIRAVRIANNTNSLDIAQLKTLYKQWGL